MSLPENEQEEYIAYEETPRTWWRIGPAATSGDRRARYVAIFWQRDGSALCVRYIPLKRPTICVIRSVVRRCAG